MKLMELPAMLVESSNRTAGELLVEGRFDRLDGVREFGWFRLARGQYATGDLSIVDASTRAAVFKPTNVAEGAGLQLGAKYPWFDAYWQVTLVEAIVDESHRWERLSFRPTDAVCFRQGTATGWQEVGGELPEGATEVGIAPGRWDHEHCNLCSSGIDVDAPIAYRDEGGIFLCLRCFERFGATHDVAFQLGA